MEHSAEIRALVKQLVETLSDEREYKLFEFLDRMDCLSCYSYKFTMLADHIQRIRAEKDHSLTK